MAGTIRCTSFGETNPAGGNEPGKLLVLVAHEAFENGALPSLKNVWNFRSVVGTVRPSPWRQAVDLANMMVILALRTDAERVYERALLQFAPEDLGEAFAATRSVTLPSQSRSSLALLRKERGIDLVADFRRLAPPTEPISIQRWSPRRLRLTFGALVAGVLGIAFVVSEFLGVGVL